MAIDQQVNYRINVDDAAFQSKLSQLRASIDSTVSGIGGAGMMGGGQFMSAMGMMAPGGGGLSSFGGNYMGGLSDFGSQIRPVSYMPPAIAMQPHFGMIQVQQTLAQAGLGMLGPAGQALRNPFGTRDALPMQISMAEYSALSGRMFGARMGDAAASGIMAAGGAAVSMAAGGAGMAAGSALGGGAGFVAGGLGIIGGMAAGTATAAYVGAISDMAAENRGMQNQLAAGSFRFISGGPDVDPLTGRGFNRRARAGIADAIQSQELQDVRFGMPEMRQILESGMQMDTFSGTKDAEDFKKKFKGLVENIKTVTATLHTSLQEGVEVIRGFRDMGVTDPSQINRMTVGSEMMGRMSGRTGMEMMAIGQTGAEMFRGTGVRMGLGFEMNQMNAVMVRSGLDQGTLSREIVAQAGGENALAQQMTANALASFQSPLGRGAMMANFDSSTGHFKSGMVGRMMGQTMVEQVQGAGNIGLGGMLKLQANQEELISGMDPMSAQMFGIASRMGGARMLAEAGGVDIETGYKAYGKMQGISDTMLKADLAMMRTAVGSPEAAGDSIRNQVAMEDFRNRFGAKRITNYLSSAYVQPVQQMVSGIAGGVEEAVSNIALSAIGGNVTGRSPSAADLRAAALVTGAGPADEGIVDVRGSIWQNIVGGQSGNALADSFNKYGKASGADSVAFMGAKARLFSSTEAAQAAGATGMYIGNRDGKVMILSAEENKKLTDAQRGLAPSEAAKEAASKEELNSEVQTKLIKGAMEMGNNFGLTEAVQIAFPGETLTSLSAGTDDKKKATLSRLVHESLRGTQVAAEHTAATGTYESADAAAKARAGFLSSAAGHEGNVKKFLQSDALYDKLGAAGVQDLLAASTPEGRAAVIMRTGVELPAAVRIAERVEGRSAADKKEAQQEVQSALINIQKAGQISASVSGGGTAAGAPAALTKDMAQSVADLERAFRSIQEIAKTTEGLIERSKGKLGKL